MDKARQYLEEKDLEALHLYFEHGKKDNQQDNIDVSLFDERTIEDFWTSILEVLSSEKKDIYHELYAKVKNSNLKADSKRWWMSIIPVLADAPVETLRKIYAGNLEMTHQFNEETIPVICRRVVLDCSEEKLMKYAEEKREQEHQLRLLKQKAAEDQAKKQQAEDDLRRHREGKWN